MIKRIKDRGFTLVELLAVIVVLAIILIIAIPRILNVVEDSDKEAFKITGEQLIKGAKDRQVFDTIGSLEEKTYIIEDGAFVGDSIPMNGKLPDNGTIHISSDGITSMAISDGKWCAMKTGDSDNVIVSKDIDCVLYIPEVVPEICFSVLNNMGELTITDYDNSCSKNPIIPSTIGGLPVKAIGSNAFYSNQLTSVKIPNSVTSIGYYAFYGNHLTSVTIPSSITSIRYEAFRYNQLTSVTIPNSVTSIEYGVFNDNQLPDDRAFIYSRNPDGSENTSILVSYGGTRRDNVIIPNGVIDIGESAFAWNQLTSVTIPNSVTSIGDYAFRNNQLTSVTIPSSVIYIGGLAFNNNQLTSVTIPDSVTIIGIGAFLRNQLTSITIGNSVTSIEDGAFQLNRLISVIIPSSVTSIGVDAFSSNQLTSVTIGKSVSIQTSTVSPRFYSAYVAYARAAGRYTAPSQSGTWTKQP